MEKIDSVEKLEKQIQKARIAQKQFEKFSQEKIDEIFKKCAMVANANRIPFAKQAVAETNMGVVEDKVIKNHYASEFIYNKYKDTQTVGTFYKDDESGIEKIYEPLGIIGAVIPTTNPTSTTIFKILLCLKTRNSIIISPHPRAKKCTIEVAKTLQNVLVELGCPKDIISWIDEPSLELTNHLMQNVDTILATGGLGMVKSAYSSGKPAIGVGSGNVPAILHKSCDIRLAVNSIIHSKTFDNGMICASEQAVIVDEDIYEDVKKQFQECNCHFLTKEEKDKLRLVMLINGKVNDKIVGQKASTIAKLAGIEVREDIKLLIGEVTDFSRNEEFAHEKLSPILAMYKSTSVENSIEIASRLLEDGGLGHTSSLYLDEKEENVLNKYLETLKTCRIVVNTPSSHGGIGDIYNFGLEPSLTLGCGSWGSNSISENIGVKHLLNIKTVAKRRKNMLWLRVPEKVYVENGCTQTALNELKQMGKQKVFIVTDRFLYEHGYVDKVQQKLKELKIDYAVFPDVIPDPTLENVYTGLKQINSFNPDCIIAFGGGSAMDAAKIMWLLYEHPQTDFMDMALRFMDIRKRVYTFPKMGEKAYFIAIPTTAGTGSEVTPFAVITDEKTNIKYPIADYELLPNMAIIDSNYIMDCPKSLIASSGIDALVHCLEALVSTMATDYTDSLAIESAKNIFKYLPRYYANGKEDMEAVDKMANSATMAGIAFANAFLGVCHSMAHKLGAIHHIPHGIANALLISQVIEYNSSKTPTKLGTFSKYDYPKAIEKYARLSKELGFEGNSDEELVKSLIDNIEKLKEQIGIKQTIADYGVDKQFFEDTLELMSEMAFDDQCTGTNPRYPLIGEIQEMYKLGYYGKES